MVINAFRYLNVFVINCFCMEYSTFELRLISLKSIYGWRKRPLETKLFSLVFNFHDYHCLRCSSNFYVYPGTWSRHKGGVSRGIMLAFQVLFLKWSAAQNIIVFLGEKHYVVDELFPCKKAQLRNRSFSNAQLTSITQNVHFVIIHSRKWKISTFIIAQIYSSKKYEKLHFWI